MAKSETDVTIGTAWLDLTIAYPELAGVPARVQNKSMDFVEVNFSPSSGAPVDLSGYRVLAGSEHSGTAAHIWVRSESGSAVVACGLDDPASSGGGSTSGGAVTVADGSDIAIGAKADTAYSDGSGAAAGSLDALLKGLFVRLAGTLAVSAVTLPLPANAAQDGADTTGSTMPAGGAGIRGWLSGIYTRLAGTLAVSVAALPLPANAAQDGADTTGSTMPAGGAGIRGWLSGIYTRLAGTLAVSVAALPLPANAAQDGADTTASTMPAGGAGIRGWLSGIYTRLAGTLAVSVAALPLPANAAQDGADTTASTMPAGGAGIRGWLSAIFTKLSGSLAVTGTFWPPTQPVSGTIQLAIIAPAVLTLGTPVNFTTVGSIHIQVDNLSGGDSIAFAASLANGGTAYPLTQIVNAGTGAQVTSITANGLYELLFSGGKYITATKTGTASTPTITASANLL